MHKIWLEVKVIEHISIKICIVYFLLFFFECENTFIHKHIQNCTLNDLLMTLQMYLMNSRFICLSFKSHNEKLITQSTVCTYIPIHLTPLTLLAIHTIFSSFVWRYIDSSQFLQSFTSFQFHYWNELFYICMKNWKRILQKRISSLWCRKHKIV